MALQLPISAQEIDIRRRLVWSIFPALRVIESERLTDAFIDETTKREIAEYYQK